ncbi:MAG: hypothetical protein QXW73_02075 [Nitrososphaerales archaeon]
MMAWTLAREEFSYYIYDENVKPIGYFRPDYTTSAEDKIIDMITDEAHVKGGRLTLYIQPLPSGSLSLEKFTAWAQGILRKLSAWEKFQRDSNQPEPQIGMERGMLSVVIDVKFKQPAELTKKGLTHALDSILADLRNKQMI